MTTSEMNGKEMITFKVKCLRTGKVSSYKSEMIQLLDEDDEIQDMLDAKEVAADDNGDETEEGTEEESLPGTPPEDGDGFDDLGAIDSPKLETLWKCETCGKSSPAAMRLCPVCRGRLRPPGLV